MKPPSYWDELWHEANYPGDPRRRPTGSLVGKSLGEFVAMVQADAAADIRERAAKIADDEERKAQESHDAGADELPAPALRHAARRIRALPLEEV